jgi:hypothetical protein
MAITYDIIDRDSREITSLASVLSPVTLSSVSTSTSSNEVTVASTTGCYPGMPVAIPGVPVGSFIWPWPRRIRKKCALPGPGVGIRCRRLACRCVMA